MTAPTGYSIRTVRDFVGHEFGASAPITVGQDEINLFADVTGDHQWIHVDVERACAQSPFGGPVAHGFLTLALLAAAVGSAGVVPGDAKGVINYGVDKIRFIAPVPAGARVTERPIAARRRRPRGRGRRQARGRWRGARLGVGLGDARWHASEWRPLRTSLPR